MPTTILINESEVLAAQRAQEEAAQRSDEREAPPPPPTPLHTSIPPGRGNKGNILASLLEISLENEGEAGGLGEGGGDTSTQPLPQPTIPSAARTMIELKAIEKMRNEMNALEPVPSRKDGASAASSAAAATAMPTTTHKTGLPFSFSSSALEQATASFGHETGTLASFERMHHKKGGGGGGGGGGRKAVLSTKARQRKVAGSAKEEAYAEKLSGRVIKSSKRKERMERLRRIY